MSAMVESTKEVSLKYSDLPEEKSVISEIPNRESIFSKDKEIELAESLRESEDIIKKEEKGFFF